MSHDIADTPTSLDLMSHDIMDSAPKPTPHHRDHDPGPLLPSSRQEIRGLEVSGPQAPPALARRRRPRSRTTITSPAHLATPDPARDSRTNPSPPRNTHSHRQRCRRRHDPRLPRTRAHHDLQIHNLAHTATRRADHPATPETTPLLLATLQRGTAQRDLAIRLHPRPPHHRRRRRGDRLAR